MSSRYKLSAKNLFLTYPQCNIKKEEVSLRITEFFEENLSWCVVAEEDHKDGTPHIHCIIALKERVQVHREDYFDFLTGKHGNYQGCRNVTKVLTYVTKDNEYVQVNIDVLEFLRLRKAKKSTKSAIIAQYIIDGNMSLKEIMLLYPGFVMMHQRKIRDFQTLVSVINKPKKKDWIGASVLCTENNRDSDIARWLNKNIKKKRKFKQEQLYIWGDTNMGKTSLIEKLSDYLDIYYLPAEDYYDTYLDNSYDLVVMDEFKGQKRVSFLNQFLQGSTMPLPKKGSQYVKCQNLPCIFLSNYSLRNAYKNIDYTSTCAFESRFQEIYVDEFIMVKFFDNEEAFTTERRLQLMSEETFEEDGVVSLRDAQMILRPVIDSIMEDQDAGVGSETPTPPTQDYTPPCMIITENELVPALQLYEITSKDDSSEGTDDMVWMEGVDAEFF